MAGRESNSWTVCGLLVAGLLALGGPARLPQAQAQDGARAAYDFETDAQGFTAFSVKDGNFGPDGDSTLKVTREKAEAKVGSGALAYGYKVEPGAIRALIAEARVPAGTHSVRFWVRSSAATQLLLSVREQDGSDYQLPFYVPAFEWVQVAVNLDELAVGQDSSDENGKLDLDQVNTVGFLDLATMLVNLPGDIGKATARLQGPRTLWLDDLQLSKERAAKASGPVQADGKHAYLVDNFEAGVVKWTPARVTFAEGLAFDIFPANVALKVQPEAAGPGMARTPLEAGGKGLRFSYKRGEKEVYALVHTLEKRALGQAERLHLNVSMSQKSLVLVQVKEKDDSEYQYAIQPDNSVGWQEVNVALSDLTLGDQSKDENGKLDPDQIKEIALVDASALLGLPGGDTTMDLDAVYLLLK